MVSDSDLVTQLQEILRDSDLDTTTPAIVRRQLEAHFGVELTDKKAFVREQIDAYLETHNEEEEDIENNEEEETEEPVKAKKRRGGFNKVSQLSPQLEKVLGTSQLARTEVVKQMWVYIRKHDLQDPKNKRNIICDELLHDLFRVKKIDMFQMNKALSKHIWPLNDKDACVSNVKEEVEDETSDEKDVKQEVEDETSREKDVKEEEHEETEEESEDEKEKKKKKKPSVRKRKKRKLDKSEEEKPKKKGGGFTKVCSLSPELQAFTGIPQLARTEVVKMLWKYIKENKLQDPSDGRTILCDETLRSLFNLESINMFQMNKELTKHISPLVPKEEAGTSNDSEKGKLKIDEDNDEANEREVTLVKTEQ